MNPKRKLTIGMTALAAAAFAGGAYAATQESAAVGRQAFLNDVAKRLNVTPKQLDGALQGAYLDQLQAAVAAGKITQAQANAIKHRLQRTGATPFSGGRWFGPFGGTGRWLRPRAGDPGFGPPPAPDAPGFHGSPPALGALGFDGSPAAPDAPGFHGFRGDFEPASPLGAAAGYMGISGAQLLDQLAAGKSLAQIAQAHGKTAAELKAVLAAAVRARLDKLVSAKLITGAQEQKMLSDLSTRLDKEINATGLRPRGGGQAHVVRRS